ncbi:MULTISPECIES: type II toxin-antitoxin system RelE/ParE family toxin [Eikenella]|uniref:Addiction module toxin RelE n=1 Tax=Eikenella longinqua TaxID=1795827 RepID=A0A1A9RWU5_9NEIS|nr:MULTISPECIES: type II toxin-antitoxin system RelE/ParE family toxin [Eikenella]OAM29180.1 hypothetical protein A7P95_04320 [Eikenella longinqua]
MKTVWSKRAQRQRLQLLAARADYAGLASARKADAEIRQLLALASLQPAMGKAGIVEGTRELYPARYRLVYRHEADQQTLFVLVILPQWRKWP